MITIRCTRSRGPRGFWKQWCSPRPGERCRYVPSENIMKQQSKRVLRYSVSILLGFGTMFGLVMLTNPVGEWCADYFARNNFDILLMDVLANETHVIYCALFGVWTMLFLILIRRSSGRPLGPVLPKLALTSLILCLVVPALLGILYRSSGSQPTIITESILFAEILLIGIASGIWWSKSPVLRFGT